MKRRSVTHQDPRGFTLLELLLVVIIMSAVAFMAMSTVGDNMGQVRYEDTRNRLAFIRTAVLGPSSSDLWVKGIQSGYVVDNGRLPESIDVLVNRPAYFYEFAEVTPLFDPIPDSSTEINDGVGGVIVPLNQPQHLLMKGHRESYVTGAIRVLNGGSYRNEYRDGWGSDRTLDGADEINCPSATIYNFSDDPISLDDLGNDDEDENHGWCVTLVDKDSGKDGLYIDSYGMDGELETLTGSSYERDMAMNSPILFEDWQTNLSGRAVRIVNMTGSDINFGATGNQVRASLLIYINDANDDDTLNNNSWRRVSTGTIDDAGTNACLDGSDADDLCGGSQAPRETTVLFPANTHIPIGEHLLVLVSDSDTNVNTTDDTPDMSAITGEANPHYVTARVKFFSRGGVPNMVLEIR